MINQEKIILVDPNDNPIGEIEKHIGHRYAMLHRAFSVVIFRKKQNKLETLLQQRQRDKYHGGGLWTNACCSHPQGTDTLVNEAQNRLLIEMGIQVNLKPVGVFHYVATFANGMYENEIDHVFIGYYEKNTIPFNHKEVENFQWIAIDRLLKDLELTPQKYTPWLKSALDLALITVNQNND